jgi:hypothetical protein
MRVWLEKLRDYFIGALGGFLSGAVVNGYTNSLLIQIFGYQEGWYRQFAFFLAIPLIILLVYIATLSASASKWRFLIAIIFIIPVFILYITSRTYFPLSAQYGWIEFTSLWTMAGQIAGVTVVGSWVLFWQAYDRMQAGSISTST